MSETDMTENAGTPDPPVTVRTFNRQEERMAVLAFLQAEGIDTHTPDGNMLSIDPGMFVAVGFYKLQVPQSQVATAQALLAEWDDAAPLSSLLDTGEWAAEEIGESGRVLPWVVAFAILATIVTFVLTTGS